MRQPASRETYLAAERRKQDRLRGVVQSGIVKYVEGFEAQVENRIGNRESAAIAPYVVIPPGRINYRPRQMWVAGWNAAVAVELLMRGVSESEVARTEGGKTLAAGSAA